MLLRALAGVVAALAAVGVGHGVAGLIDPVASPILAIGSTLIDAAPTPAKEFAVRTFGTYDKPILVGSIGVVLLVFAAGLGLVAWRRRPLALVGISLLGVAGLVAAVVHGGPVSGIPSLVAGVSASGVLVLPGPLPADDSPSAYEGARSRRSLLLGTAGVAALAASAAPVASRWTAFVRRGSPHAERSVCPPRCPRHLPCPQGCR